ncbi:MAG: phosphatase PAP2 family protein [Acidobacteriota bacterium]
MVPGAAAVLVFVGLSASGCRAFAAPAQAEPAATETTGPAGNSTDRLTLKQAGKEFLHDAGRIWSAPARLRTKDIAPVFALGVVAAALVAADEATRGRVQSYAERHPWVGDVSPVVTELGGPIGFAAAGAFFGAGLVFKNARARDTGYLAADAVLQSLLVDALLKGLSGRRRPCAAGGVDHWSGPGAFFKRFGTGGGDLYESFPSGHTAAAFALATVVSLRYRHSFWVGAASYSVAAAVGLSRMAMDRHWLSDVVAGAAIGHLVARLVVRNHDRPRRLVPALAGVRGGLALCLSYDSGPFDR